MKAQRIKATCIKKVMERSFKVKQSDVTACAFNHYTIVKRTNKR